MSGFISEPNADTHLVAELFAETLSAFFIGHSTAVGDEHIRNRSVHSISLTLCSLTRTHVFHLLFPARISNARLACGRTFGPCFKTPSFSRKGQLALLDLPPRERTHDIKGKCQRRWKAVTARGWIERFRKALHYGGREGHSLFRYLCAR